MKHLVYIYKQWCISSHALHFYKTSKQAKNSMHYLHGASLGLPSSQLTRKISTTQHTPD